MSTIIVRNSANRIIWFIRALLYSLALRGIKQIKSPLLSIHHHLPLACQLTCAVAPRQLLYDKQLIGLKAEAEELQRINCASEKSEAAVIIYNQYWQHH